MANQFTKITVDLDLNDKEAIAKINNFVKKLESAGIQSKVVPAGAGKTAVVYPREYLRSSAWDARKELGGKKEFINAESIDDVVAVDNDFIELHKVMKAYIRALKTSTQSLVKLTPAYKQMEQRQNEEKVAQDTARGKVSTPALLAKTYGGDITKMQGVEESQRQNKQNVEQKKKETKAVQDKIDKTQKWTNRLNQLSNSTLMLNMGFLGMWFSFYGLFNMFRGGLMTLITPLQDLGGTLAGGALAKAFGFGGGFTGGDVSDMIEGWKTIQGAMGAIQLELAKAGAKIFKDPEVINLIKQIINELSSFLTSDTFKQSVVELVDMVKNSLPDIISGIYFLMSALKMLMAFFRSVPYLLQFVMSSIVMMPLLSVLNSIVLIITLFYKTWAAWKVRQAAKELGGLGGAVSLDAGDIAALALIASDKKTTTTTDGDGTSTKKTTTTTTKSPTTKSILTGGGILTGITGYVTKSLNFLKGGILPVTAADTLLQIARNLKEPMGEIDAAIMNFFHPDSDWAKTGIDSEERRKAEQDFVRNLPVIGGALESVFKFLNDTTGNIPFISDISTPIADAVTSLVYPLEQHSSDMEQISDDLKSLKTEQTQTGDNIFNFTFNAESNGVKTTTTSQTRTQQTSKYNNFSFEIPFLGTFGW